MLCFFDIDNYPTAFTMAASKDRVSPKKRSKRGRKVRDLQHKIADLEEKFKTLQESLKNQPAPAPTTVAKTQSDPGKY